jgi:hypothetical protein
MNDYEVICEGIVIIGSLQQDAAPWLPAPLLWSVIGGAGAVLVEVLCETALQRQLDEEVFARS